MVDTAIDAPAARRSPLYGLTLPGRVGLVTVADAGPCARFIYRGAAELSGGAFGVDLPTSPLGAVSAGERAALWLGPDEWLLLAPVAEADALAVGLTGALAGKAASVVDVSHRNAGLVVSGPRSAWLLGAGCPIDLDAAAFPAGMCARTLLGKAEIVLWRRAADEFRLEVQRSYVPYAVAYLAEAARDI